MKLLKKYAFMSWEDCMKTRAKLRKEMALPPDKEEDRRVCRVLYQLYFNNVIF